MKKGIITGAILIFSLLLYVSTESVYFTGNSTKMIVQQLTGLSEEAVNFLNWLVRKLTHFTVFGVLAVLLYLLFRLWPSLPAPGVLAWTGAVCAGALDEWHQSMQPDRSAMLADVLIDAMGAAVFLLAFFVAQRVKKEWKRDS